MNCQEARRGMSLALDRMVSRDEETALQMHMARCATCHLEWKALQSVSHLLTEASLASPGVDLALRIEQRLRGQQELGRWFLGLIGVCLWLGMTLCSLAVSLAILGWLLLQEAIVLSTGVQVLSRLLLVGQTALEAVWLLAVSLPRDWLSVGVNGCLVPILMLACLWAWLALGRQRQRVSVR